MTPRARIVVIEDDAILVRLLHELLTAESFEVHAHSRAEDAHVLVRNVRPDAVLLDLRLGGESEADESGWRVLDALVLDPETRHIPVVVASDSRESIEARRPALLGQHGVRVLLKPYDVDQLLAVLGDAIGDARALQEGRGRTGLLTPRQLEIARLIALGFTNVQIAERLIVQPGTVANHVSSILSRLGVSNRAQVAAWAASEGRLPTDQPAAENDVA